MTSAPTAYAERRVSAPEPAPQLGPLGRLARLDLPPPWPHRARLAGRARPRRRALHRLRRQVQGRLLRARLGLHGRPEPARERVPGRSPATRSTSSSTPTRPSPRPPSRPTSRRCWPRWPGAARRHRRRPLHDAGQHLRRRPHPRRARRASTSSTRPTCPSRTAQQLLDLADAASTDGLQVAARRPDHRAGRAGRDRLRGPRHHRRRDHPAADLRLRRRRRPARSSSPSPASPSPAMLTGLVIAFIDAPDWSTSLATMMGIGIGIDYALLMVTRFREWRAVGLDPEAATVATLDTAGRVGAGRRQHRRDQHARPVRDGPVVHARRRRRHDRRRPRRDGRQRSRCSPRCSATSAGTSTGCGCRIGKRREPHVAVGGHVEPSGAGCAGASSSSATGCAAALLGVAILLALAAPFLGVRFGFPDAGNDREGTSTRTGLRHALRRLRPRRQRSAAARRRAARRAGRLVARRSDRRAAGDARRRRRHPGHGQPGRRHRGPDRHPDDRPAVAAHRGPRAPAARHR